MQEENTYPASKTILELMEELGMNATVEEFAGEADPDRDEDMTPWLATYTYDGKTLKLDYGTGSLKKGMPTADGILSQYLQDVSYIDLDMMEFIIEMGYTQDVDALRKGQRIYQNIQKINQELRAFLGDHFDAFLEAD